jgi:hypothetical protein
VGEFEDRVYITDAAMPNPNVMLDLETWGTRPGSAIRSIGAVCFDPYSGELGDEFYCNVSRESCVEAGLKIDASTEAWWAKQSKQAQDALALDQVRLEEAVTMFNNWFKRRGVFCWSQGANFDQPIYDEAARAVGKEAPWKFWDSRCTRTSYDIARFNPKSIKRIGTHHNALEDAIYQAQCVQAAYRKLYKE